MVQRDRVPNETRPTQPHPSIPSNKEEDAPQEAMSASWCCNQWVTTNRPQLPNTGRKLQGPARPCRVRQRLPPPPVARRVEEAFAGFLSRASRRPLVTFTQSAAHGRSTPVPLPIPTSLDGRIVFHPSTYRDSHFRALVGHHGHGRATDIPGTNAADAQAILLRRRHHRGGATGRRQAARGWEGCGGAGSAGVRRGTVGVGHTTK